MSKKVLNILSSPKGENSISNQLGDAIISKILEKYTNSTVIKKDLIKDLPPHISEVYISGLFAPADTHNDDQKESLKYSDNAIKELNDADIIIINTPMYEFGVTSFLKAYLDQIVRAGKTFRYNEQGVPEGLLKNKKLYIAMASGGIYSTGQMAAYDFVVPYLKSVLGFIGLTDVSVFRAEGLNKSETRETALSDGIKSIVID